MTELFLILAVMAFAGMFYFAAGEVQKLEARVKALEDRERG